MNTDLSLIFKQLRIASLEDLIPLYAVNLAQSLSLTELVAVSESLRGYLWRQKAIPAKLSEIEKYQLPVNLIGANKEFQRALASSNVKTISEFIWRDSSEQLTNTLAERERLAVRLRIFCLLLLPADKLEYLKSIGLKAAPDGQDTFTPSTFKFTQSVGQVASDSTKEDDIFLDDVFTHQPWLSFLLPEDFSPPPVRIEKLLFQDVTDLPIATSRRHEIWAGAQMKASAQLQDILDSSNSPHYVFSRVYLLFSERWETLNNLCTDYNLLTPIFATWINEVITVRKDFYNTPRSRFRDFLRSIEKFDGSETVKDQLEDVACAYFETLWMFPTALLKAIRDEVESADGELPSQEKFNGVIVKNLSQLEPTLKRLLHQGTKARNLLVTGYFRAVLRYVRNFAEKENIPDHFMDLVQEGAIGLITAADKYDYRRTGRFITYAISWIWQTTGRAAGEMVRDVRVPVHRLEQFKRLETAYEFWLDQGLETPTAEHLCLNMDFLQPNEIEKIIRYQKDETKLTPKLKEKWDRAVDKTAKLLKYIELTLPLSTQIPSYFSSDFFGTTEEEISLGEIVVNRNDFVNSIDNQSLQTVIHGICDSLIPRQREIIKLRFGLEDGEERTLEEIGQIYGLTRERIRQLEAKAMERLQHPSRKERLQLFRGTDLIASERWPRELIQYLSKRHGYWSKFNSIDSSRPYDWQYLDQLVAKLPGLDWHQSGGTSSRRMQLDDAMQLLGNPAHYADITEQLNDMIEGTLEDGYVYTLLNKYEDSFILLGEGVFSRVDWEQSRKNQPILPFCPAALPDLPNQFDTLFESILVANDVLKRGLYTGEFVDFMLKWSGNAPEQSNWFRQSILNAYYLVGLIPYTYHFNGNNPQLRSVLPNLDDLSELRRYCLKQFTMRLTAMSAFWWILQHNQPGRVTDFAASLVEVHPLGLNDVINRVKLLAGLGAIQRIPYGYYRLTSFGNKLADQLAEKPVFNDTKQAVDDIGPQETDFGILTPPVRSELPYYQVELLAG